LLRANLTYADNLEYDSFPKLGSKNPLFDGCNSNSFTSGLLNAVGLEERK